MRESACGACVWSVWSVWSVCSTGLCSQFNLIHHHYSSPQFIASRINLSHSAFQLAANSERFAHRVALHALHLIAASTACVAEQPAIIVIRFTREPDGDELEFVKSPIRQVHVDSSRLSSLKIAKLLNEQY